VAGKRETREEEQRSNYVPSVHLVHKGQRREGGEMDLVHDEPSQEVHGPSLRDHHEPSARTRSPFEIRSATWHSQEPARVRAGPAQTGPTRPVSSPDLAHQGLVSARSALTVDCLPVNGTHMSVTRSVSTNQSLTRVTAWNFSFSFSENHLIFRNS
jgi:hypothetical protein